MDKHFFEAPLRSNLPVLLGLLGIWNSSFLHHSTRAILPYAQALVRFAAHIQQVDMEVKSTPGLRIVLLLLFQFFTFIRAMGSVSRSMVHLFLSNAAKLFSER